MRDADFVAACRENGMTIDEPKRHWLCKVSGCDLPPARTVNVRVLRRDANGRSVETSGTACDIECRRCGRQVGPMDFDYPMIPA